ncbi:hypothetical protein F7725_028461 [Dissostichus mawsoni]|uniref:Gypsy retrotransposon integrase-like protein 1 n=1 Tax=Dissostichus mawsoni TaxID=36200 RepID=A0A7J5XGE7_DISMA|nr:hypothetical protein F7725_028461 [Dissostichus mawsoni]
MKRRADTFRIKDGELYYICRRKRNKAEHLAKVVYSSEETNQLFEEFHCSNIGGHCGVEKTHCAIIARYYWPGMENDIRKWVSWYLQNNVVEYTFRFKSRAQRTIAHCPQCQAKTANIKEKLEYSPIEVKINNGILVLSLNKMVAGHPKRWDQVLQSTMFGLQTKKQLTTKYSLYYLMFGREARYPSEVPKEYVVRCSNVILFKRFHLDHLPSKILTVICCRSKKRKSAGWSKGRYMKA